MLKSTEITKLALTTQSKPLALASDILRQCECEHKSGSNVALFDLAAAIRRYRCTCSKCKGITPCECPFLIGLELNDNILSTRYYPCRTERKTNPKFWAEMAKKIAITAEQIKFTENRATGKIQSTGTKATIHFTAAREKTFSDTTTAREMT